MSVDRAARPCPGASQSAPVFLRVRPGDFVIVAKATEVALHDDGDWWMGQVVF